MVDDVLGDLSSAAYLEPHLVYIESIQLPLYSIYELIGVTQLSYPVCSFSAVRVVTALASVHVQTKRVIASSGKERGCNSIPVFL